MTAQVETVHDQAGLRAVLSQSRWLVAAALLVGVWALCLAGATAKTRYAASCSNIFSPTGQPVVLGTELTALRKNPEAINACGWLTRRVLVDAKGLESAAAISDRGNETRVAYFSRAPYADDYLRVSFFRGEASSIGTSKRLYMAGRALTPSEATAAPRY